MNIPDSCPNCCRRDIAPAAARQHADRAIHGYACPNCGATWATVRDLTAYSELHALSASRRRNLRTERTAS